MQETQPETPGLVDIGQPHQQVGDDLVLVVALRAVTETGLADAKRPVEDGGHHYHFQVFALDVPALGLDPAANRDAVLEAMRGHVLAKGEIVGTFDRDQRNPACHRARRTRVPIFSTGLGIVMLSPPAASFS